MIGGDAISNQAERRWQPLDQRHFGVGLKQGLRSVEAARPGPRPQRLSNGG